VSFTGLSRFKKNLDNLAPFMTEGDLTLTKWTEDTAPDGGLIIRTKWRFRSVIGVPWQPLLAAAGGTDYYFDAGTNRVSRHVESWDIEVWDALKQLLRPNPAASVAQRRRLREKEMQREGQGQGQGARREDTQ